MKNITCPICEVEYDYTDDPILLCGHDNPESPFEAESVDLIASGYEWICPNCDYPNHEIEITESVDCKDCGNWYKTNPAEHAHG